MVKRLESVTLVASVLRVLVSCEKFRPITLNVFDVIGLTLVINEMYSVIRSMFVKNENVYCNKQINFVISTRTVEHGLRLATYLRICFILKHVNDFK